MMTMIASLAAALAVLVAAGAAYVPYWTDYWMTNDKGYPTAHRDGYRPKYPYFPRDYEYPPPLPHQQKRGEDAYPGRFLGMGAVNTHFGGRQVELVCTLHTADAQIVSNVVWTKVKGPYPFLGSNPPYECPKCTYYPIQFDDHRIKSYDYNGKSILFIHEVLPDDYGIYRCSATAQVSYRGDIETVYQIVKL